MHKHYAKRIPLIKYSFGLYTKENLFGICTFGLPCRMLNMGYSIFGGQYTMQTLELNRLVVNDNLEKAEIDRLFNYLDKAVDLINENLLLNKVILVHCYAGKQRSASLIAAYLMKYAQMTYLEAINVIKSKRFIAFTPGINFKDALIRYQNFLHSNNEIN